MPSDLQRKPSKFNCLGIDLAHPVDMMPDGYYPFVRNSRSIIQGTVEVRPGYTQVSSLQFGAPVHSIRRVNNLIPGAASANQLFIGTGTNLYSGPAAAGPFTSISTGFSGNPLSSVVFRPDQSPESWIYIADASKNVKASCEQVVRSVGIAPPSVAPTPEINSLFSLTFMEGDDATGWTPDGVVVTSAPTVVDRAASSTTISAILYDTGSTGFCTISPSTPTGLYDWLQEGCSIRLNNAENVIVQEVHPEAGFPPVTGTANTFTSSGGHSHLVTTTGNKFAGETVGDPIIINSITYIVATLIDSNNITVVADPGNQSGVPFSGNSSTTIASIIYDSGTTGLCSIALTDQSPNIDRNSILLLDFNDTVRVLNVTQGPDGLYSLRCSTPNNHTAGGLVRSVVSIRVVTFGTYTVGEAITSKALEFVLTTAGTGYIGGAQSTNASSILGRPVTVNDYMHISIRLDNPNNLSVGRIALDLDPNNTALPFTGNYLYKEFRPSDLQSNASNILSATTSQQTAIQNQTVAAQAASQSANSIQLDTGESQWVELIFPISDLVRVGTDSTLSLATVSTLMIELTSLAMLTVDVAAWYITGTFGPDVQAGSPVGISYQYRYRDSRTGAKSVPSPGNRYQLYPVRQEIAVGVTASTDPQVDTIDIQRFDPSLGLLVYVGSTPNATGNAFIDDTQSSLIAGNPSLETNLWQPWPILAPPLTSVVNVAGTSIKWVSGATFPTNLQPGTVLLIANDTTQLYALPISSTILELTSNLGALTNATMTISSPVLLGMPLPVMFGPLEGPTAIYSFAIGDLYNPGTLYWSNGNDLDSTDTVNTIEICSPSEPLIAGCVWQTLIFVASAKRVFLVTPSFGTNASGGQTIVFTSTELTSTSGCFSPWGMAKGPQGVYMVGRDGLYWLNYNQATNFSAQIYPMFPHDGQPAYAVNGFQPVLMTDPQQLRMAYCDEALMFDYEDITMAPLTMEINTTEASSGLILTTSGSFWPHLYPNPVITHYWEEVPEGVEPRMLMGTSDGYLLASGGTTDLGSPLFGTIRTPSYDFGDPRSLKLFMDMMTDADATGGYTLTLGFNNYLITVSGGAQAAVGGRQQYLHSISSTDAAGLVLYRNVAAQYVLGAGGTLYEFEPSYYVQPFYSNLYTTQLMDFGMPGWKQLRFGRYALISTASVTIQILNDDGVLLSSTVVPSTNGILFNDYVQLPNAAKGRLLRFSASASTQFVLFPDKTFVRIKKWGGQQFAEVQPFLQ